MLEVTEVEHANGDTSCYVGKFCFAAQGCDMLVFNESDKYAPIVIRSQRFSTEEQARDSAWKQARQAARG